MAYTEKDRLSRDVRYQVFLDKCNDYTRWVATSAASTLVSGTEHLSGSQSIEFDKEATGRSANVYRLLEPTAGMDLSAFAIDGQLNTSVYLPDVDGFNALYIYLVTGQTNFNVYAVDGSKISAGWNNLSVNLYDYVSTEGCGVDWEHVGMVMFSFDYYSNLTVASGIKIDNVRMSLPQPTPVSATTNPTGSKMHTKTFGPAVSGTGTGWHDYYVDCEGLRYHGIQFILNPGTGTISGTLGLTGQRGLDPSALEYHDVSVDYMGSGHITESDYILVGEPIPGKYLKISVNNSDDTASWSIIHVGLD